MEKIIELCGNCNEEIKITKRGGRCPICGNFVKPCCLCNTDKVSCSNCPFDYIDLEDIQENIQAGVDAIEKHLESFEENDKEDYFYMINNIEVLINHTKQITPRNKKDIVIYKDILKDFGKNNIYLTKLEILDHLQGFDKFNDLSEDIQSKTLDFLYSYWLEADLQEHTLFDYVEVFCNSCSYDFGDILGNIEHLSYKEFVDIIEERQML